MAKKQTAHKTTPIKHRVTTLGATQIITLRYMLFVYRRKKKAVDEHPENGKPVDGYFDHLTYLPPHKALPLYRRGLLTCTTEKWLDLNPWQPPFGFWYGLTDAGMACALTLEMMYGPFND